MVAVIHSWFQTQTAQVEMVNVTSDGPGTWGGEAGWESRGWRRSGGGGGWGLWGRPGSGEKGVRMKGEARGGGAGAGDNLGGFGDKRLKLSGKRNQQRPLSRRRVGGGGRFRQAFALTRAGKGRRQWWGWRRRGRYEPVTMRLIRGLCARCSRTHSPPHGTQRPPFVSSEGVLAGRRESCGGGVGSEG